MIRDLMIPGLDGLGVAKKLRDDGKKFPILMLSSIATVTGLDYGKDGDVVPVDEFVEKPVDPATLMSKVSDLLNK